MEFGSAEIVVLRRYAKYFMPLSLISSSLHSFSDLGLPCFLSGLEKLLLTPSILLIEYF